MLANNTLRCTKGCATCNMNRVCLAMRRMSFAASAVLALGGTAATRARSHTPPCNWAALAAWRVTKALLLNHAQLPNAAGYPRDEAAEKGAADLHRVPTSAGAGQKLLEHSSGTELHRVRTSQIHACHRQPSVKNSRVE